MPPPDRRPAILVVDDDRDLCAMLGQHLARDFDVALAGDGEEALALARDRRPDVVLLDVLMPRLSGFSVAWVFKNDPRYLGIPVIFMTAYSVGRADMQKKLARADAHVAKPISLPLLSDLLLGHLPAALREVGVAAGAGEDRRTCPRRSVQIPGTLAAAGREEPAVVTSVSYTGVYVESRGEIDPGTEVLLAFSHRGQEFRGPARVLYATLRDGCAGLGLQLQDLTPGNEQVLDLVLSEPA